MESDKKIPVINFSEENMKPGSDSWLLTSKRVLYGLEEYGCFEVICEDFPPQLHNSVFNAAKDLHNLPIETKTQKASTRPQARNYIVTDHPDCEFVTFGIDYSNTLQGPEYFTNIMWPQGNETFSETVLLFSKWLEKLTKMTLRMVVEKYGLKIENLNSLYESSFHMLRLTKYRPHGQNIVGLATHVDSTFTTVIHQHHEIGGLQVKTKDNQWIDVKPSQSSFLVLAGEAFMAWSNDRVSSCVHRVRIEENKARYSAGLFSLVQGIIQVPEELVDEDHPLRYKPFDQAKYNQFFVSNEARKFDSPIKFFCGI